MRQERMVRWVIDSGGSGQLITRELRSHAALASKASPSLASTQPTHQIFHWTVMTDECVWLADPLAIVQKHTGTRGE